MFGVDILNVSPTTQLSPIAESKPVVILRAGSSFIVTKHC